MQQLDENREYVDKLVRLMWEKVGHFSNELDEYASRLFERPVRGSWRIFVYVAKNGEPESMGANSWYWDNWNWRPHYPVTPLVESLEIFASIYLHEVAHGWIYLLTDYEKGEKSFVTIQRFVTTAGDRDDEELCWEISRIVCRLLEIEFEEGVGP